MKVLFISTMQGIFSVNSNKFIGMEYVDKNYLLKFSKLLCKLMIEKNVHAGCFFNLDRICRTRFEFLANSLVFALNVDEFGYGGKEAIKRAKLLGLTEYRKTIY